HASDPATDLTVNTTQHLIDDIERLREHLRIERWLVYGVSWGSTLGLAYAQAHPARVSEVVLSAVTMTRHADIDWLTRGVGRFFPEQWQAFRDGVPEPDQDGNLAAAYARLLAAPDPRVRERAAQDWCRWEDALVSVETGGKPSPRLADPWFRDGFTRLVTHYFANAAWLAENQLLAGARQLAGIPAVLIHGRLDLGGPLHTAWALSQAWPGSELVVVEGSGHVDDQIVEQVVIATDRFAGNADHRLS
ncbi:MAG: alpha/beta fold hydrolase, partial [Jatrophihabitantaceae bacterium]